LHGTQWLALDGHTRLFPVETPRLVNFRRAVLGLPLVDVADITNAWPAEVFRRLQSPNTG
jgi:hypothetical protein